MDTYVQLFAAVRALENHLPPVAAVAPVAIDADEFLDRLQPYRDALIRFRPDLEADLHRQATALAFASPELRSRVVSALARADSEALYNLATELDVTPETLMTVSEFALRPYLRAYARSLTGRLDTRFYQSGRCPVCGRQAHLGHIDADNIKYLHCLSCETIWRFARVGCAHCGCVDSNQLGYFTVEDDDEHRVEYCLQCGGYIKAVDQRARGRAVDWLLEDAATLHLDQLAQSEGYHRNAPGPQP